MKFTIHFKPASYQNALLLWYRKNKQDLPWRRMWQKHKDPYTVLVSEIMLQQTTIKAVMPKYIEFLERFPSLSSVAEAKEEEIRLLVKGLGYYRRFRHLHLACQALTHLKKNDHICWPESLTELKKLPGIGEYTAAAVGSIAFNWPLAVVDGNVKRVICRIFDIQQEVKAPTLLPVYKKLSQELLNGKHPGDYNQALMELGQRVCIPKNPRCEICPIAKMCLSRERKTTHLAPLPAKKKLLKNYDLKIYIVKKGQQFGIQKRSNDEKFLRGIPGFLTNAPEVSQYKSLGFFRHHITQYKINVEVCAVEKRYMKNKFSGEWVSLDQVESKLVSSLDSKAWKHYQSIFSSL